jgi:DNA-binding GntR family transcriptional regulator
MLEVAGVEEKVCERKNNTVEIDKWWYEELISIASRIDVLVSLIDLEEYINVNQILTIIGTASAKEVMEKLKEKDKAWKERMDKKMEEINGGN